jgi:hypothetical protein
METLITYFLKVNGLLIGFYLVYFLFLKEETFFNWSRWYFLLGIVLSLVLPLLTYTKIIWVAPTPMPELPEFIPFQQTETPVIIEESIDWNTIVLLFYGLIILILVGKMLVELTKLLVFLVKNKKTKVGSYFLIEQTSGQPFSFFNYVVFQKKNYTETEIAAILQHETVHVRQKHSIDVLFSQLFCCVFWVNPVCWWYKKAMQQNLEYIADAQTVAQTDSFIYQNLIVKATCSGSQLALTNPFYQSLIKKRILMINTTPSNKKSLWKYAVVLPLLTAFFLMFQIETVAQVKDENKNDNIVSDGFSVIIDAKTTDANFKELEELFTDSNLKLKFSNVKRNKAGEITRIKIEFRSKQGEIKEYKVDKSIPIETIELYKNEDQNSDDYFGFRKLTETKYYEYSNSDYEGTLNIGKKKSELDTNSWTLDEIVIGNKKAQLIINGKLQTENKKIAIPNDHEIDVMKQITAKEVKEKYNLDVKEDGNYYEITTKKEAKKTDSEAAYAIELAVDYSENEALTHIERIKKNKMVDAKKALILFNGKEISYKDLDKIDEKTISSSGNSGAKHAVKKYGNKAKNGVIFINTKEYDMENNPLLKEMYEKVENENLPTQPNKNQLYIINGKEYKSEDLKGKKIVLDGSIIHYSAEEAIKKYGKKGKNGVLVFEGKSTISEGTNKEISYEAKEFKNTKPKNIKLNFEKGKTYIIGGRKYSYDDLKDKNLWLYAETPNKIEEKNGVVTISGDVLEDAGSWNSKEIISLETTKSTVETRVFELSNGKTIIVSGNMFKAPKYPALDLNNVEFYSNDVLIKNSISYLKNINSDRIIDVEILENNKKIKLKVTPQEKPEPKTIELKNGVVVVVFDGDKIKFPGYPTHFLNRLKIESKGKILEDNIEFFKNYDLKKIKDIKIELESDSKESKVIKKLYIIE